MATIITSAEALGGITQGDFYFDGTDYHLMTEKGLIRLTHIGSATLTSPTLTTPTLTTPTISAPTITGEITSNVLQTAEHGVGLIGTSTFGAPKTYRRTENGIIITTVKFDLTGLASSGTTEDAIGLAAGGIAILGRNVVATNGIIFRATLSCIELPAGTTVATDIDIATNSSGTIEYGGAVSTAKLINGASLAAGQTVQNLVPAMTANHYLYIVEGTGSAGTYTGGMFILTMYGHALLA
jgi:hypothetical protein